MTGTSNQPVSAKVAVLGGSGFIGLNVVRSLLARGVQIKIMDLQPPPDHVLDLFADMPGNLSVTIADIRQPDTIVEGLGTNAYDAIVHAAVVTSDAARERRSTRAIVESNLLGVASVLDALGPSPKTRLVYIGSGAVFARQGITKPISEDHPHAPTSLYGITKATAEQMVRRWSDLHERDVVVTRLGWVFGPFERDTGVRDTLSAPYLLLKAAVEGTTVRLSHDARIDWLYSLDAGEAIAKLALADRRRFDVYNIGAGLTWRLSEWCDRLHRRYPGFHYTVGGDSGLLVAMPQPDDAPLDATRFEAEFGPVARLELDEMLDAYLEAIDHGTPTLRA